jgi:hypothetical protein
MIINAKIPRGLSAAALIISGKVLSPSSVAAPIGEIMCFRGLILTLEMKQPIHLQNGVEIQLNT